MEEVTLEKIDTIRKRTGLNYGDAKIALENNNGNVVDTLIYLENNKKSFTDNVSDVSNDILGTVKDIINKGNVNRIKIKRDNKTLVDIPVNAGIAVGALTLFSPAILAIGAVTAIASKISIEIERPDGSVEVVNHILKNTFDQTIEKARDFAQDISHQKNPMEHMKDDINFNDKHEDMTSTPTTFEENKDDNNDKNISE
jgi:translation elongation factor EF-Ts